ncbi:ABC transporter ATP-binding protein [Streptococcus suis]|uniref:ABC transporter ATP-binding protein n=1 Tax=Streptococcus suis TaxID=1307 RepID=A0A9X4MJP4_STRSU|nr:ABC transporter ATP-binding protein [Streptococcus parasuis]MDG4511592.1 ABC transporter ATP-binding protein [Streptococcus suis]MDG4525625.1 ABC transporter ATP-binding protein [Streptococcus suis]ULL21174.1 ABC transporter ATP-binding protein [Streptococcus suis]WFB91225.1 ABC transporter ATP-binding protein [Streptococcus parasuis]HEM3598618.1 ABC transporter ATP-binding protein [Streptococcus suis]
MIQFDHVTKAYGETLALDDLNLRIESGEIFGLIGHNGAGKTTTISLLTSIIEATEGLVLVDQLNLAEHRNAIKKRIAYVPDSPDIFLHLTAYEYWNFMGKVYEVPQNLIDERICKLGQLFDMTTRQHETIDSFSHGMRQKTIIIGALISNPDIWILDEPLTGLDPQASFDLKQMMKEHAAAGNTVLFSTHVLSVAEQLCDRIGILRKGRLIFLGSLDELKSQYPDKDLETIYLELAGRQQDKAGEEA